MQEGSGVNVGQAPSKTNSRCRHRGIGGADQWQVFMSGCLSQMGLNRLDCEGTGYLAGVGAAHAGADDIESERRVSHKAILVMRPLKAGIGFGAVQSFEGHTETSLRPRDSGDKPGARPRILPRADSGEATLSVALDLRSPAPLGGDPVAR